MELNRRAEPLPIAEKVTRRNEMYEVYEETDAILPQVLRDAESCDIRIEFHDESVILHVGARDWSWDRKTGKLTGCGTLLGGEVPDAE